ncbi:MAG: hypothetical protein ABEJ88_02010 [Halobacterium sp.]
MANTFQGVDDQSGLIEEVLEPGGRLIVVNWQDRARETTTVGS